MWNTLRRKRVTISSQAALSLSRQRSISAASAAAAAARCAAVRSFRPSGTRLAARRPVSSHQRRSLELGLARDRPGAVPVAGGVRGGLAEPLLQDLAAALLEALVVDLGVAGLAALGQGLLI